MKRLIRRPAAIRRPQVAGFSLIEVMIALLVLALGLLGFALLQTLNLRYTQSANTRTQATNLAYDLLDQMRANRLSAVQFGSASFATGDVSVPEDGGCARPLGDEVPVAGADSLISRWQCQVVQTLGPGANADVSYDSGLARVTVSWTERALDSTQFTVETRL